MEILFCWYFFGYSTLTSIHFFSLQLRYGTLASFIILTAGCYAFELFSLVTGKGHYELLDVLAGVIGGVIGIGAVLLLINY